MRILKMPLSLLMAIALRRIGFKGLGDAVEASVERRAAAHHLRRMMNLYESFISSGDLCFDVGANVGDRTSVFRRLNARVIAIEPQPVCLKHLSVRFEDDPNVIVVDRALGSAAGETEMLVSESHTISSMSAQWVESVRKSGRFEGYEWGAKETVAVTTLDDLIDTHGVPKFCKIDVEGYEEEVLRGLSQPIPIVSFEFTPEYISPAVKCVTHLAGLAAYRFNYSLGESMTLELPSWIEGKEMIQALAKLAEGSDFGDVYARASESTGG